MLKGYSELCADNVDIRIECPLQCAPELIFACGALIDLRIVTKQMRIPHIQLIALKSGIQT
jgi:hypothetical protein